MTIFVSSALLLLLFACSKAQETTTLFNCNVSSYYSSLASDTNWTRQELHDLIRSTHVVSLSYKQVWEALIDLDGTDNSTIRLLYANQDVPARPFGTPATWNREHVWPQSRGVNGGGMDFTDLHHLYPSDWNVNAARGNEFFGPCGFVQDNARCKRPAHVEAANGTESDGIVFLPPLEHRGDIARALMYMDLRYDGQDGDADLILVDCPFGENEMAYKSQLLTWHNRDPPNDKERKRNDKICQDYQGNRNPFVDFPDLALQVFGPPQPVMQGQLGYNCSAGNESNGDSSCQGLGAGDVMVALVNSDNPDSVALVALTDIPSGIVLYLTDNAWTGTSFLDNEGVLRLMVPQGGIRKGTVFGYGNDVLYGNLWQSPSGSFALAAAGDSVLVYCQTSSATIVFLSGLSYSNSWAAPGLDDYETSQSALPLPLKQVGSVALPHLDNYMYNGIRQGTKSDLQQALANGQNWIGSNSQRYSPRDMGDFDVMSGTPAMLTRMCGLNWVLVVMLLLLVVPRHVLG